MCFLLDLLQSGKDLQFHLRKTTSASDKNIWNVKGLRKSWEQLYEHYCYNSVKSINVSHNIESEHASVWIQVAIRPKISRYNRNKWLWSFTTEHCTMQNRVSLFNMCKEIPDVWWDKSRYIYLNEFIRHVKATI